MLVAAGVLAIAGSWMLVAPSAFARLAHTLRVSSPAPDRAGRVVLATRTSGLIFLALAMALVATSAWG